MQKFAHLQKGEELTVQPIKDGWIRLTSNGPFSYSISQRFRLSTAKSQYNLERMKHEAHVPLEDPYGPLTIRLLVATNPVVAMVYTPEIGPIPEAPGETCLDGALLIFGILFTIMLVVAFLSKVHLPFF